MNESRAINTVRAAGGRVTPERKLLLRIITENAHLDASEIFLLAKEEIPKISLSTVYRVIGLLRELRIVSANDLGEDHCHYEVQARKHHHCICLGCGRVIEIPSANAVKALTDRSGFEVVEAKVELTGYCRQCSENRARRRQPRSRSPQERTDSSK
jgi:Fe2+ or Zn2+ uptake regulation protein